ncbi:MFS transporter [Paenibacillus sp. NPDC057934]|uniref:MFS transporter n=1 Tax=Paenibacillus sp. NPDC057934 TaxID=3346282 RepID=UPI0036DB2938
MKNNKNYLYAAGFFGNFFFERGIWILYLQSISYSMFQIGILQAVLNFTMFVSEIPTGVISDRVGRKKALVLGHSFIILYLATFIFFENFWFLFIGHIFYGIGLTFISGTDQAYLYDSLKQNGNENSYGKVIGMYNAFIISALAISMALGGLLQGFSWKLVFVGGLAFQIMAVFIISLLKEIKIEGEENKDTSEISYKSVFNDIREFLVLNISFKFLIVCFSVFSASISVFYMFSQDIFGKSGISVSQIAIIYSIISVLQVIFSVSSHKLETWFSTKGILVTIFLVIGVLYLLINVGGSALLILSFILINSICELVEPLSSKMINDQISQKIRATVISILNLFTSFLMFLLFPLLGYLSEFINSRVMVSSMGFVSIMISLILIIIYFNHKKKSDNVSSKII